jgi:hypothetical protein
VLNISSENFVCDGVTYPPLSYLPNGGNSGTGSIEEESSFVGGGGTHIWDGIVAMIVSLNYDISGDVLPQQNPIVPYIINKVQLVVQAILSLFAAVYVIGISGNFFFIVIGALIAAEIALIQLKLAFWVGRLLLPFLK